MFIAQVTLVGCLALALISCDKSDKKDSRSGYDEVLAEAQAEAADATAAEAEPAQDPAAPSADPAIALSGKDLYGKLCASCHQPLAQSDVGKTPMNRLTAAIANEPTMAGLKDLSEPELAAIVEALNEVGPGKGKGKPAAAEEAGEDD